MRRHGPDEVRAFRGVDHRECEGAVVGGHMGCELAPDVRLVAEAVEHQQGDPVLAPLEQVQIDVVSAADAM